MKQITVVAVEQYEPGWPDGTLVEIIDWFKEKLAEIPEEHRAAAKCSIDSSSFYDSSHAMIEIAYWREETPFELGEWQAAEERRLIKQKNSELATLRDLQAKYPGA